MMARRLCCAADVAAEEAAWAAAGTGGRRSRGAARQQQQQGLLGQWLVGGLQVQLVTHGTSQAAVSHPPADPSLCRNQTMTRRRHQEGAAACCISHRTRLGQMRWAGCCLQAAVSGFESANVVWGSGSHASGEAPGAGPAIGIPASGRAPVLEAADIQVGAGLLRINTDVCDMGCRLLEQPLQHSPPSALSSGSRSARWALHLTVAALLRARTPGE